LGNAKSAGPPLNPNFSGLRLDEARQPNAPDGYGPAKAGGGSSSPKPEEAQKQC